MATMLLIALPRLLSDALVVSVSSIKQQPCHFFNTCFYSLFWRGMQSRCFKWVRQVFADAKRHPHDAPMWCTVGYIADCFKMGIRGAACVRHSRLSPPRAVRSWKTLGRAPSCAPQALRAGLCGKLAGPASAAHVRNRETRPVSRRESPRQPLWRVLDNARALA